jgi:type III secretion protein U
MSEKKFPPSHTRLRQARERGQTGISQDVIKVLKITIIAEIVFASEAQWKALLNAMLSAAVIGIEMPVSVRLDLVLAAIRPVLAISLGLAFAAAAISVFGTLVQTGFNVAPQVLAQSIQKLNPANNLKQLASPKKLFMVIFGAVKLGIALTVAYLEIRKLLPDIAQLFRATPEQTWAACAQVLHSIVRMSIACLFVLAVVDFALQRYMNYRTLRMDIQELKQDSKNEQGDPHIKAARKNVARQIALEPPSPAAPKPTAIVVNPEHIAVALAYNFEPDKLPLVVAKGREEGAVALRELAQQLQIPVIKYAGLARQLYATGREGSSVPRGTLRAVALLYQAVRELSQHSDASTPSDGIYELDEELAQQMLRPSQPPPAAAWKGMDSHTVQLPRRGQGTRKAAPATEEA